MGFSKDQRSLTDQKRETIKTTGNSTTRATITTWIYTLPSTGGKNIRLHMFCLVFILHRNRPRCTHRFAAFVLLCLPLYCNHLCILSSLDHSLTPSPLPGQNVLTRQFFWHELSQGFSNLSDEQYLLKEKYYGDLFHKHTQGFI